jgi:hypothetical protein
VDIKTSTGIFDIGNSNFSYPEFEFWISKIPPSFWISEILILDIKNSNFRYKKLELWISSAILDIRKKFLAEVTFNREFCVSKIVDLDI